MKKNRTAVLGEGTAAPTDPASPDVISSLRAAEVASTTVTFTVESTQLEGTHFVGVGDRFDTPAGRPVVVLAHGLGGTRDSGLEPFARAFAAAGLDAFTFDYRGFGTSGGQERQVVSLAAQLADWQGAVAAAGRLPGVDAHRIVLWGVSLAGGHVLQTAQGRDDIAAVIAVVPMVDGLAAMAHAWKAHGALTLLKSSGAGIAARVRARLGRGQQMMPLAARPGEPGCLTVPGALEQYLAIAGPTWRNEVRADVGLELGTRAPAQAAASLRMPVLVQIEDFDVSAPPHAAAKAAFAARAEVRHYPGDHFDVFPGRPHHDRAVQHAVRFLERHLA